MCFDFGRDGRINFGPKRKFIISEHSGAFQTKIGHSVQEHPVNQPAKLQGSVSRHSA